MKLRTNFFGRVNDIPLNFKFLIIYIFCLLIPIIIINATFLDSFSKIIHEREGNNYKISIERTKVDISKMIEGCIAASHSISTDRNLYDILDNSFESSGQYYEVYDSLLRNKLNMYTAAYDYISSIGIYVDNPTIRSGGTYYYTDNSVKSTSWYKDISATKERVLIKTYIGHTKSLPTRQIQYLSILKSSHQDPMSGSREKILKVDVNVDKLYSIFKREKEYLSLYLIDPDKNIVCSSIAPYDFENVQSFTKFETNMLGTDNIVIETTLGNASYFKGWMLIGVANSQRISKSINETLIYVLTFAFISLLISSLLIFIIVRSYNYRLKKLSKHMLKFKDGQFDLIEINEGRDEIGGVIRNFNLMAQKNNTLINDVYKLELQKKSLELERVRAEINFLQSQMNPHFLFNTLNALLVVCVKNNYTAIIDVIKYLSKTLRRLLSWKDDLVKIEEELSFTEMYLKIEKFRFCDMIEYSISVDESLLAYKIPKMSLQPLVENACKHGIQAIKGVGIINITIVMNENNLKVCVEDNGNGMDTLKLNQLLKDMTNDEELNTNIGIRNVYRRLRLYYGDSISFNIESQLNIGTKVYFVIPCEMLQPEN
jgi:two-component system, sensor histidine kinase YesM